MRFFRRALLFAVLVAVILICGYNIFSNRKKDNIDYSFLVAGHTYGKPGVQNEGLHPPFKAKFEFIRKHKTIKFGVFTGDIVYESSSHSWDKVDEDISKLGIPIYFARGNHDTAKENLFVKRYAINGKTYYSFEYKTDLFIILDPNLDKWNISGEQLESLKTTIKQSAKVNNIFVFFHQLIWWDQRDDFNGVKVNSKAGRGENTNFWTEVEPLFRDLSNNVYMFAGDVGAFKNHVPIYYKHNNITLIASGMGGGFNDNFVVVNIYKDNDLPVSFDLIWLNKNFFRRRFLPNYIERFSL